MPAAYAARVAVDWSLYADFFPIEGCGVVVVGAGKSKAGRVAAGMNFDEHASTDLLELGRDGAELRCRNVGPRGVSDDGRWRDWERVDYFALCLRDRETELNYRDRPLALVEVQRETFIEGARWYLAFPHQDRAEKRLDYFRALSDTAALKFVVVPWMESHEAKGQLMRDYFFEQGSTLVRQEQPGLAGE